MRRPSVSIATGRALVLSCLILTLAGAMSCARIEQPEPAEKPAGDLTFDVPASLDAIPAGYGRLIAVHPHSDHPDWAGLWFEGEDQTLTVVWVDVINGRIHDQVLVIPRS
jgi:hypothetical protein